ncbi:IQ domain-containing protein IQM2-like [Bidens hawaiensis]|uniref:IQ domain-containing protein IQM2-like n=1 Tax=Bidens hawaiensis TaxID=980011 RepID=UPI004048F675
MGLSISCPFAACTDLETSLSSIGFQEADKSLIKSDVVYSVTPQKMRTQESFKLSSSEEEYQPELSPKHEAAIKLQKVYKSFRTRRKLADCAVLIEQIWWEVLDSAELRRSSISYFDIDKHESAISRWARARTRAARVGKGLSKNCKAQKLALQHWLEAIDPRHRYGHNLHFYYLKWLHSQSKEPFFYWLDIGEGKEVNLVDKCPRSKLQQQCIKYLGPVERKDYEVAIENGKLLYKQTSELLDTTGQTNGAKWIFVLSTTKTLYVGIKKKGYFQHSSFLSGGAALAAGRIIAEKGVLKAVWPHSGHYRPTEENFQDFISFLHENDVDTSSVKMDSIDDDDKEYYGKQNSVNRIRTPSSEEDYSSEKPVEEKTKLKALSSFTRKLSALEIPKHNDLFVNFKTENHKTEPMIDFYSDEEHELVIEDKVSKDSHKETESFNLGRQISCKWSTGAGPRIGCLRDYPSELQSHALEHAKLSPRSLESLNRRNSWKYRTQPSPLSVRPMNLATV